MHPGDHVVILAARLAAVPWRSGLPRFAQSGAGVPFAVMSAAERAARGRGGRSPARFSSGLPAASSAFGGAEVIEDALSVIRFPGFARLAGGVVLVEADQQIAQLTADGRTAQQRGQFGQGLGLFVVLIAVVGYSGYLRRHGPVGARRASH
jgi:hypothetical protein